ncbi:MAG TPA: 4Fe-4S dicluster domain-containing protein [Spirochaetes bacterium]|nr:4Fe-4S dicluster domain-containing protein [Spirochaetota bacterium]
MEEKTMSDPVGSTIDRRAFIKMGALVGAGTVASYGLTLLPAIQKERERPGSSDSKDYKPTWRMIIDPSKCAKDCEDCITACRKENNVHEDLFWIRKATIVREMANGQKLEVTAPMLCNQCDNPPCHQVCPVDATFIRPDDIVDVDKHRCIGCRYCVIGCPYDVRVFNFYENPAKMADENVNPIYPIRMHGVAESCNFCDHRIDKALYAGKEPITACAEACKDAGHSAIVFGDMKKPNSPVSIKITELAKNKVMLKGLREDLGLKPKVLYVGL